MRNRPPIPDPRPRLLLLHGGGSSADIFRTQFRTFANHLVDHFRMIFADAPFFCPPGPGVLPVFSSYGPPFRRWLRWDKAEHAEMDEDEAREELQYAIFHAMLEDESAGGRGPWVGVGGFSQGAKMAASLAYDLQVWRSQSKEQYPLEARLADESPAGPDHIDVDWKFVILMNGRPPIACLSAQTASINGLQSASEVIDEMNLYAWLKRQEGCTDPALSSKTATAGTGTGAPAPLVSSAPSPERRDDTVNSPVSSMSPASEQDGAATVGDPPRPGLFAPISPLLEIPTVHIHGLEDPGLHLHVALAKYFCAPGTARIVEWAGDHRVAVKKADVEPILEVVMQVARESGAIRS